MTQARPLYQFMQPFALCTRCHKNSDTSSTFRYVYGYFEHRCSDIHAQAGHSTNHLKQYFRLRYPSSDAQLTNDQLGALEHLVVEAAVSYLRAKYPNAEVLGGRIDISGQRCVYADDHDLGWSYDVITGYRPAADWFEEELVTVVLTRTLQLFAVEHNNPDHTKRALNERPSP